MTISDYSEIEDIEPGSPRQQRVRVELSRHQFGALPVLAITFVLTAAFGLLWLWPSLRGVWSTLWIAGIFIAGLSFGGLWFWLRSRAAINELPDWFEACVVNVLAISGLLWSIGVVNLFTALAEVDHWPLIATLGCLILIGACTASALPRGLIYCFAPPLFLITGFEFTRFTVVDTAHAGILIAFGLLCFQLARNRYRELVNGILAHLNLQASREKIHEQSEDLARLVRVKDHFLAAITHDLRQPAQSIGLLAQSVNGAVKEPLYQSQTEALVRASDQINELVSRFFDLAQLDFEQKNPKPQWFDLQSVLSRLSPTMEVKARFAGISLLWPGDKFSLLADPLYVERILKNLISNAIEHSEATIVSVEVKITGTQDQRLSVQVIDNGIGLSQEWVQSIEGQGSRVTPLATAHSVQGLGLSIVARLAEQGGYRLGVRTNNYEGTCVTLEFSEWRRQEQPVSNRSILNRNSVVVPIAAARRRARQSRIQVLVIEDDALVRVGLMSMISSAGYDVTVCDSGADAIELVQNNVVRPDVVIADWYLSDGKTAADFMPAVQAILAGAVPVIVLTGQSSLGLTPDELGRQVGTSAVRFLQKPVRVELLVQRIRELLDEAVSV